ncbi:MAG TPA: uracil-DNA glycosylase [Geobacteraceae bacterium]|nr:uracil-DNA glycosylase [Geobacteraceae bacterium]
MGADGELQQALQSLRVYLQDLLDTGVDGLPVVSGPVSGKAGSSIEGQITGKDTAGQSLNVSETEEGGLQSELAEPEVVATGTGETLDDIRSELGKCILCPLGKTRTNLVFGDGSREARLVFVGEAPGRDEDLQGIPFVGKAGELLTSMIQRMGLKREDVYICNVLKCRPPNNRNPLPSEVEKCQPFLLRQLRVIKPEIIVALGTFAAQTLLETKEPISKLRGRFHDYHGIPLMPTFHPSFLLRSGPDMRWVVWEDMVQVLKRMGLPVPDMRRKK